MCTTGETLEPLSYFSLQPLHTWLLYLCNCEPTGFLKRKSNAAAHSFTFSKYFLILHFITKQHPLVSLSPFHDWSLSFWFCCFYCSFARRWKSSDLYLMTCSELIKGRKTKATAKLCENSIPFKAAAKLPPPTQRHSTGWNKAFIQTTPDAHREREGGRAGGERGRGRGVREGERGKRGEGNRHEREEGRDGKEMLDQLMKISLFTGLQTLMTTAESLDEGMKAECRLSHWRQKPDVTGC